MNLRSALIFAAAAASLVGACTSTPDPQPTEAPQQTQVQSSTLSAQELFLQGNQALDQHDFDRAIAIYNRGIQQDPARWDIYMNKAIAQSAKHEFTQAVSTIDQALSNGGDKQPEVYFNLGNIYQNRGLYGQSIKAYRTSLALRDAPHVDTIMNIAAAQLFMRDTDGAEETYRYLLTLAPDDARIYLGLGLIAQMRDQYQNALEQYDHVILIAPDYEQVYFNKASLLHALERYPEAIENFEHYLQLAPEGPYAERARWRIATLKKK